MSLAGCLLAVLALIAAYPSAAQQLTHLSGLVLDPTDAAVRDVSLTVVSEDTGFRRSAVTQSDGSYVVASLQPGLYKITVRKDGFRTIIRFGVKLDVAQPALATLGLFLQEGKGTPNDGLVTVESAIWGQFMECMPADHLDEIGLPGTSLVFDHQAFYRQLVKRLRTSGL